MGRDMVTKHAAPGADRALWLSTIAFTVCFAVWTIFAIIGIRIQQDLGLNETEFGLLVGTPILTGSLSRVFLGIWTDQYGGRVVYVLTMLSAAAATFLLSFATTYPWMLVAALGVGLAGGSFAVGIAYVSKWFPPEKQGTALGIFGAGNIGAAVTKFVAPFVLVAFGWQMVAVVWASVLVVTAIIFWFATDDDPEIKARRARKEKPRSVMMQLAPLRHQQVWRFSLYYFFVFGGFVALALWLPRYMIGVYGLDIESAGMLAAAYSIPASLDLWIVVGCEPENDRRDRQHRCPDHRNHLPTECNEDERCDEFGDGGADIASTEDSERRPLFLRGEPLGHIGDADGERTAGKPDAEGGDEHPRIGGGVGEQEGGDGRRQHGQHIDDASAILVGPDAEENPTERSG